MPLENRNQGTLKLWRREGGTVVPKGMGWPCRLGWGSTVMQPCWSTLYDFLARHDRVGWGGVPVPNLWVYTVPFLTCNLSS